MDSRCMSNLSGPGSGAVSPTQHPSQAQPRWFTPEDWAKHRRLISTMYTRDHMELKPIQKFMTEKHGLRANKKMYMDRFKTWGISKKLQADEVVALLRIKASRDAVGAPVTFWRWGRPITAQKLERYQRDNPSVRAKVKVLGWHEAAVNELMQTFLPSRGLVALSVHPSRGLRADETLDLTESMLFPLRRFGDADISWCFDHTPHSPWLILEALFERGLMVEQRDGRELAWYLIQQACNLMEWDIVRTPNEFVLQLLWVLDRKGAATSNLGDLVCQIMRHASGLFKMSLGPEHPYTILFAGAAKLKYGTPAYGQFVLKLSEILIDTMVKRLQSIKCELSYSNKFIEVYDNVSLQRQGQFQAALQICTQRSDLAEIERIEMLYTLALLQKKSRDCADTKFPRLSSDALERFVWRRQKIHEQPGELVVSNEERCLTPITLSNIQASTRHAETLSILACSDQHASQTNSCHQSMGGEEGLDKRTAPDIAWALPTRVLTSKESRGFPLSEDEEKKEKIKVGVSGISWKMTKTQWVTVHLGLRASHGGEHLAITKMTGLVQFGEATESATDLEISTPSVGYGRSYLLDSRSQSAVCGGVRVGRFSF